MMRLISFFIAGGLLGGMPVLHAQVQDEVDAALETMDPEKEELLKATEAVEAEDAPAEEPAGWTKPKTAKKKTFTRAEAFVAGPSWEFDGFVAGGQDSRIKSMFVLNDIVYLNIGSDQGIEPGDTFSIFRRGDKVRDPQTGQFLGYEVRRAAVSKVTDKVDRKTCAVRIMQTYEGVEVGDLVRKEL